MERQVIRKWFWAWDFEKEEQWLNTMASSGWVLDKVSFCTYTFVRCEPGEYTVRLEMRNPDNDYVSFMEETGAEYIGRIVQWIYFRKKTEHGRFDLFSDLDSRISHLDKIGKMMLAVGMANIVIGLANTLNPTINLGWINLLLSALLMYGLGRIHGKKENLEKERMLRE
ncbi:MAG: DUF2812 domain-containing protein [Clostridiales bacterium]|nr:DUF2812 domain-containing protein [Clostridiales bacterium]